MILTTHALVGAVIGKNIQNPWIIAIVSLVFHYVLDTIRHGEYLETFDNASAFKKSYWRVILDFSVGLAIIIFIIHLRNFNAEISRNIFIGIFFSMLPDSFTLIYWKTRWKFLEKIYKFHSWIHRLPRSALERQWNLRNEIYDILIFIASIILLFTF